MDKKENRNGSWLVWIALGMSVITMCLEFNHISYHPISLREPDLNWILSLSISAISIAVTAILGVQIHTVITIDKRVQKKVEKERKKYQKENIKLMERLKAFTIAVQKFTTGNIYLSNEEYNEAFCAFCLAAIEANEIGEDDLVSNSLEQAVNLLNYGKYIYKCEVVMEYMDKIEKGMIGIPDKRAIYIYNHLSSLPSFD